MFCAPLLSVMRMVPSSVLMMNNSRFLGLSPSLLLCEVAVDSSMLVLGTSRRLAPCLFMEDLSDKPIFCNWRGEVENP